MKKNMLISSVVICTLLLLSFPAFAVTYYVDSSRADNTGDGRSWSTAKKTITAAVTLAGAGDAVEISGGSTSKIYTEFIDISGKNGGTGYLTIKGSSASGHNGTVVLATATGNVRNIFIHGASSYIKIENLTIQTNSGCDNAIYVYGGDNIQVNNCIFTGTSNNTAEYACIEVYNATNCEIKNNRVNASFDIGIDVNGDDAITRRHLVEGNIVTGFYYAGIKVRRSHYSIVRQNYVSGPLAVTYDTKIFLLRGTHYCLFENNVGEFTHRGSSYQHYVEIRGFTGCGTQGNSQSSYNTIQNNTFVYTGSNVPREAIHFADDSQQNVIQNNIFQGSYFNFMGCWDSTCSRPGTIVRNNIITGTVTNWNEAACSGTIVNQTNNKVLTSPSWYSSGIKPSPYYTVTSGLDGISSVANGYPSATRDYNQNLRSSPPDIGAFEYSGTVPSPQPPESSIAPPSGLRILN